MLGSLLDSRVFLDNALSGLFALVLAAIILTLARRNAPAWTLLILLQIPVLLLLSNSDWRFSSLHGFMHTSIVYEIFERGFPPSMPLAAGEALHYSYGFHLVVAKLMTVVALPPPWFFAGLNITCLAGIVLILDRIARVVSTDRSYRLLAIAIMLFGYGTLVGGQFGALLARLGLPAEVRLTPLSKFTGINTNQMGLLFFAVTLLGLLQIISTKSKQRQPYVLVAAGLLGAGFFYPIVWPGACVVVLFAAAQVLWQQRAKGRFQVLAVVMVLLGTTIVLLPWLLEITGNNSALTSFISFTSIFRNIRILLCVLAVPAIICWYKRDVLRARLARVRQTSIFLGGSAIALQVTFVLVFLPEHTEYKILVLSGFPLGLLLALPLADMIKTNWRLSLAIMAFLILPFSYKSIPKLVFGFPVADRARTDGRALVHQDDEQSELYAWIADKTPVNSVFVDTHLTIPVFGRRLLFIGLDSRRESGALRDKTDGWNISASYLIRRASGADRRTANRRRKMALKLLAPEAEPPTDAMLDVLTAKAGNRPLYVVARDRQLRTRLAQVARFDLVFDAAAASVFVLAPQQATPETSGLGGPAESMNTTTKS